MERVGERLKKIRLEKGLSLEDVSKKTKIHVHILEALEEDRLINKSAVYVRGFLKIYCEFLGVNLEDFISGYKKLDATAGYLKAYEKPILPKPRVSLANSRPHSKIFNALVIIIALFALSLGAFKFAKAYKNRHAAVFEAKKKKNSALTIQKETPASESLRLAVRARENCWLKTKVDGKVVFVGVLRKGRFESWQAKERIEISLGNAGGVELQLNDKVISPLGRKGQVIKQILITKEEGLKIIK